MGYSTWDHKESNTPERLTRSLSDSNLDGGNTELNKRDKIPVLIKLIL